MAFLPLPPEQSPKFPYERYPYSHIHPTDPKGRQHILFRCHDCWCEPFMNHIKDAHGKTVAIVVIHNVWDKPNPPYPKVKHSPDGL